MKKYPKKNSVLLSHTLGVLQPSFLVTFHLCLIQRSGNLLFLTQTQRFLLKVFIAKGWVLQVETGSVTWMLRRPFTRGHCSLLFNPPPEIPLAPGSSSDHLLPLDQTLGILTHRLLLQRQAFSVGMNALIKKFPSTEDEVNAIFNNPASDFKAVSDNLLQFSCGKRADCFESRRRLIAPKDQHLAKLVKAIPPSPTALFDEGQFADFVRLHPTAFHLAPFKSRVASFSNDPQPFPAQRRGREKPQIPKPRSIKPQAATNQSFPQYRTNKFAKMRKNPR